MNINLEEMNPREKKDPPTELLAEAKEFYFERLKHHGYTIRHKASFNQLAEYCALTFAGLRHEIKGGDEYSGPKKGLLIYGPCGSGKTLAMSIFSGLFRIDFVYMDELIEVFETKGAEGFWEFVSYFKGKDLIIDDLGSEKIAKSYGNASPIIDFIHRRERLWKASGILTHFTTNQTGRAQLRNKYGERVVSRILGMCNPISIIAEDGRLEGGE